MNEAIVILLVLGICIGIAIMLLVVIAITSNYEKQLQKEIPLVKAVAELIIINSSLII